MGVGSAPRHRSDQGPGQEAVLLRGVLRHFDRVPIGHLGRLVRHSADRSIVRAIDADAAAQLHSVPPDELHAHRRHRFNLYRRACPRKPHEQKAGCCPNQGRQQLTGPAE